MNRIREEPQHRAGRGKNTKKGKETWTLLLKYLEN